MSTAASASPSMSTVPPYGLAMRFRVTVDGLDLGSWSACSSLTVNLKSTMVTSGGDYSNQRILPEKVEYPNIKLQRAVHPTESKTVKRWLKARVKDWMNWNGSGDIYAGGTAKITLLGAQGTEVMSWNLTGVYPVSWSGPSLDATQNKVAIETLELAHQGFLNSDSELSFHDNPTDR
jgi:phage tail-like protein